MTKTFHFSYPHSKFWLIFWMFVFFPIGLVLLSKLKLVSTSQTTSWVYDGERFWLYFWAVILFPVAILLLILKGTLVVAETPV